MKVAAKRSESPICAEGESFSSLTSAPFVQRTAQDIVREIPFLQGAAMLVSGYTLQCEFGEQSYIVMTIYPSPVRSWIFGIAVGNGTNAEADARAGLNATAWRKDSSHPLAAGIRAASWDEAWRIVCTVGRLLSPTDIQLRYGG